jgi:SAM-dependent methyltransferase
MSDPFSTILELLRSVRDIVDARVEDAAVPRWCAVRGWDPFLLALGDAEVHACETQGPARWLADRADAPGSLREVAAAALRATDVARLAGAGVDLGATPSVQARKRRQIAALVEALRPLASGCDRVVDVGCGAGHLTRIVAGRWERQAVGLERRADLVRQAADLASRAGVAFQVCDVFADGFSTRPGDLVVGLHACGEVADVALEAAAVAGASVAFVSCCLQKVRGDTRPARSRQGQQGGLTLSRSVLGLSNLWSPEQGVEVSLETTMTARQHRHALRLLLRSRGLTLGPGDEMGGLNRRRARRGLEPLATEALARRGLAPAGEAELRACAAQAAREFAESRRLSLPRHLLARVVEVAIVRDRAAFLAEQGYDARVVTVFDAEVSPRNLAVVGTRR